MKQLLFVLLLFLSFSTFSQLQQIEVCTENQEYLQDYWVDAGVPSQYTWIVQGGIIESGQGTEQITVNWLNVPYGMYNISVSVISDAGCEGNTVSLMVDVDECSFDAVYVPNCFTVNNDGINDDWGPIFSGDWDNSAYKMYIFNRWGGTISNSTLGLSAVFELVRKGYMVSAHLGPKSEWDLQILRKAKKLLAILDTLALF